MLGAWTKISLGNVPRVVPNHDTAQRDAIAFQLFFDCLAHNAPMLLRQGELHERGVQPAAAEHFIRRCMGMDRLAYRLPCIEEGVNRGSLWTGPYMESGSGSMCSEQQRLSPAASLKGPASSSRFLWEHAQEARLYSPWADTGVWS